jgi:hypothetical protein
LAARGKLRGKEKTSETNENGWNTWSEEFACRISNSASHANWITFLERFADSIPNSEFFLSFFVSFFG